MRIISTFLPAASEELMEGRQTVLMALDTLVENKSLVVGLTVGRVSGATLDDVALSQPGVRILDRCRRHHQVNYSKGVAVIAGVTQASSAKQRVRQVLASAPPEAMVLLVCANGKVYDAAFPALGIDLKSVNMQAQ